MVENSSSAQVSCACSWAAAVGKVLAGDDPISSKACSAGAGEQSASPLEGEQVRLVPVCTADFDAALYKPLVLCF